LQNTIGEVAKVRTSTDKRRQFKGDRQKENDKRRRTRIPDKKEINKIIKSRSATEAHSYKSETKSTKKHSFKLENKR